jgi:hypothetical protein
VNSSNLTPEQAGKIAAWLTPRLDTLQRLEARMKVTGFPPDDALMIRVNEAREAVRKLRLALHDLEAKTRPEELPRWIRARGD